MTTDNQTPYPNPDPNLDPRLVQLESDWALWLATLFPESIFSPFASHQIAFWDHIWSIQPGIRSQPFVGCWSRGHGKSSSAELAAIALGARRVRRYILYISGTQQQADEHVGSIASLLESEAFGLFYPELADREVGKFGNVKGWRRNRLRTIGGLTIDALGLDTSFRGIRVDNIRPDGCVLDDVDADEDSLQETERKIRVITRKVLPALTPYGSVIAIQNLISSEGIFARLANRATTRADFLVDRIVSGPIPAIEGLQTVYKDGRWLITAGTPTWAGFPIEACQDQIDTFGLTSFKIECQHDTEALSGGMYDHVTFHHCTTDELPILDRVAVWVDPAVTDRDTSDSQAIQVDGIGKDGRLYRLFSWEQRTSPTEALRMAFRQALIHGADVIGIETDQGGDTWKSVFREVRREMVKEMTEDGDEESANRLTELRMKSAKAGAGHGPKVHRSSRMLTDYERGKIVHCYGTHDILEAALRRFPRYKPRDLADAAYWSWWDLMSHGKGYTSSPRNLTPTPSGGGRPSRSNVRRLPIRRAVSL